MQIVGLVTQTQCKICRSEGRDSIDQLLLARHTKSKGEDGKRVQMPAIHARMAELGIPNPTYDNVITHLEKHCEILDDAELVYREIGDLEQQAKSLGAAFDEQGPATADSLPDRVIQMYDLQIRAELREGKVPRVTADQVRAMIDTKTRRRQNERLTDLLDIHAAALTGAVGWNDQDAIDAGPDEFAEIVE